MFYDSLRAFGSVSDTSAFTSVHDSLAISSRALHSTEEARSNGDPYSLRACFYAILGVSSRQRGALSDAERYLSNANRYLSTAKPSALLVSALLLVAAQSHLYDPSGVGPSLQAELALRMASLLPTDELPFQVLLSASFLRCALAPQGHLVWPSAPHAPVGKCLSSIGVGRDPRITFLLPYRRSHVFSVCRAACSLAPG
jgi:hypothetical protein